MNLLVTNTTEEQAYLVLRALQPHCERIVVTVPEGGWARRWSGISAWSRFVDRRYPMPDCRDDWVSGRLRPDNTPAEAAWIERIEDICAREDITVVLPSYDAEVYVLSKNLERLAERGVLCPVAPYASLARILDKSLTLEAAAAAGYPAPATRCPANREELEQAAGEIPGPWVLKPRCDAHATRLTYAEDLETLRAAYERLAAVSPRPLLQEYVPVTGKRNYYTLVDRQGEVVSVMSPRVARVRRTGLTTPCAAVESCAEVPLEKEFRALVRALGVWGCMTIQTVIDARDGHPSLMEVNPRFGHNLWYRTELGINEPAMLLEIARSETVTAGPAVPDGVLFLDPVADLLHLVGQCVDRGSRWLRRSPTRGPGPDRDDQVRAGMGLGYDSVSELLTAYRRDYLSRRPRITSPLNRGFFRDPLPPTARITHTFLKALRRRAD